MVDRSFLIVVYGLCRASTGSVVYNYIIAEYTGYRCKCKRGCVQSACEGRRFRGFLEEVWKTGRAQRQIKRDDPMQSPGQYEV